MGMYTELDFNSELKKDVPEEVLNVLRVMLGELDLNIPLPTHPLFLCSRWTFMLTCNSYYFDSNTSSTLRWDDISDAYFIHIRSNLKNYEYEIEKFVDWITPYLNRFDGDFLGFTRYEETEIPTLIFHPNKLVEPIL